MSKKKTLEEVANELKNDTLYIGASTSFFLIGDYWEYQLRIDDLSEYFKKSFAKTKRATESEVIKVISEIHRVSKLPDTEGEMLLKSLCAKYIQAIEARANAREKMDFFDANPDLRQRIVKSVDDRIDDGERGKLIVIEGYEPGRYWFKSEYDKENGHADNQEIEAKET